MIFGREFLSDIKKKKTASRTGELTQWLQELTVLAEDFALLPSIYRVTQSSK